MEIEARTVSCPYCGEPVELQVDASAGSARYVEDCQVCCQPMEVALSVDAEGEISVQVFRDDESI